MPKFTIEDVDRDIEERRARARQIKLTPRLDVLPRLVDRLKRRGVKR